LTLFCHSFAVALERPQRVFEVSDSQFPAEIGAYKYLKVIQVRYALFNQIPSSLFMVQEIFAERKGEKYRILAPVDSTKTSSVGKVGAVFEIVKWKGAYWPGEVIYQLSLEQIYSEYLRLNQD
jgi:hypothetical protein